MMNILIAPDSFKDCLSAREVAAGKAGELGGGVPGFGRTFDRFEGAIAKQLETAFFGRCAGNVRHAFQFDEAF